jgi:tetratricopeptide (TPR) repeat protein
VSVQLLGLAAILALSFALAPLAGFAQPADDRMVDVYTESAERAFQGGRYATAEEMFLSALDRSKGLSPQDPRVARILRGLAAAYRAQGRHAEADEVLKRATAPADSPAGPAEGDPMVAVSLEQALSGPPALLAARHLWVTHVLAQVRAAAVNPRITFMLPIDQRWIAVTQANAQPYLVGLERRLETYTKAVEQRGFQHIAGRYTTKAANDCRPKFPWGTAAVIQQQGFQGELVVHGVRYRAVVVESSIAVEDVVEEGYYFGRIAPDGIELTRESGASPRCVVSLKRE